MKQSSPASFGKGRFFLLAVVFLAVAIVSSWPRFGQKENEESPAPPVDSEIFLDMARVFNGNAVAFNPELVKFAPHHYNRPLVSYLAGFLGKYALGGNLRAAFSVVNILGATAAGMAFMLLIRGLQPGWRWYWLPSVLFLTAFPQMDWGYHILSDGLGMSTAVLLAVGGAGLIGRMEREKLNGVRWILATIGLGLMSSLAFLARETAWLGVITIGWMIWRRRSAPRILLGKFAVVFLLVLLGKVPHSIYSHHFHLAGVPFENTLSNLANWRYILDFLVKTGVCFNLAWLIVLAARFQGLGRSMPDFFQGWTLAAFLYMGAGYLVNNFNACSYPLRLSFALFPWIFFCVAEFFENAALANRWKAVIGYVILQCAINFFGVFLDGGQGKITVLDFFHRCKAALFG